MTQYFSASQNASGKAVQSTESCALCRIDGHSLADCRRFRQYLPADRRELVLKERVCFRCLAGDHHFRYCKAAPCSVCHQVGHHGLLHDMPPLPPLVASVATSGAPVSSVVGNSWGPSTLSGGVGGTMLPPKPFVTAAKQGSKTSA